MIRRPPRSTLSSCRQRQMCIRDRECLVGRLGSGRSSPSAGQEVVMPSQKKRPVTLSVADRDELVRITTTGVHPASMIRRARVLLALDTAVAVSYTHLRAHETD